MASPAKLPPPQPRRDLLTARFAAARSRFAAAGLTTHAPDVAALNAHDRDAYGRSYFRMAVACPFLDDENCTIHPDRPLACREYLVTSPAIFCSDPAENTIRDVPLAGHASAALTRRGKQLEGHGTVLLINALAWAAEHPAPTPEYPGIELALSTIAQLPGAPDAA
ncbi:hypothetical protein GCM10011529_25770 [Polymorphobacter glacialis]|uniref:YkgJ family cysteine cluster protein n=1 Tax=Sandarakinorhabdus glacialis TaxID=1614636 RepID=A0A917EAC5_9SPHN|nr:YkgJ family cysteine cluster protein [Polymorphobacter glacialis]GGE18089.1 hypothetical protein GCM10011529_25770 [Polymorphobacter glacialis]